MNEDDALYDQCQSRIGLQLSGKWRLDALIGVGGMAAVYAATHRNGATAAIKILHPELANHPEVRARFLREAYIANKVDHPGTVKVLDDDQGEYGEPYLVMELLRGESVDARAQKNGGRLPTREALAIVDQALAVLERAHPQGIIHRDLKPENLFLTREGVVKVLDFGIARLREGSDVNKTRTGLLMGTPAYMAPEQALGRWSDVDGRTDLWAVGAILFSLLSGRAVHEAETPNEMIIAAATRPAASLGRVLQNMPFSLVKLVDRALEYEVGKRFVDAAAMREQLALVMNELGLDSPAWASGNTPRVAAAAPLAATAVGVGGRDAIPRTFAAQDEPRTATKAERTQANMTGEVYDASFASEADIAAMSELFTLLEKALIANVQYGREHPEATRRRAQAFKHAASALMHTDLALAWNITPYSFVAKDETLWEPKAPLDRVPYQLFADGVRLLGVLPGLDENEFFDFVKLLTLDRAREVAPEDDFVTLLWDSNFEHVVYQAIDNFAEGDQQTRANFEKNVDAVVALAAFDTSAQLEDCWQGRHGNGDPAALKQERMLRLLSTPERIDASSAVQAEALSAAQRTQSSVDQALQVDPAVQRVLAARFDVDTSNAGERFVLAAAVSYCEAVARNSASSVTAPVRSALDTLAKVAPEMAIEFVRGLCRGVAELRPEEAEALCASLTGAVISKTTLEFMLDGALEAGSNQSAFAEGLSLLLRYLDGTHVPTALRVLTSVRDPQIAQLIAAYLERAGRGHEERLGALFVDADLELGLGLVRILAKIATPAASNAIALASNSPHAVVRIEALGHVEGASSERLRVELRSLLEDRDQDVRLAALKAMERYSIRIAGPYLVLRIRSPAFDKLSYEERRHALATLGALAPTRAEAVCLELLAGNRMIASDGHEQSRELAAHVLGAVATSKEAYQALQEAATKRWRSSERVRTSAQRALEQMTARIEPASAPR